MLLVAEARSSDWLLDRARRLLAEAKAAMERLRTTMPVSNGLFERAEEQMEEARRAQDQAVATRERAKLVRAERTRICRFPPPPSHSPAPSSDSIPRVAPPSTPGRREPE
jgi:hypothetical protein